MKLLIAIVTIGVLVNAMLASPRWKKRRSILDFAGAFNNNSTTAENNTVSKPDCTPLNDTLAKSRIVAFGVLENPGVTLVNVSSDLLSALQANETVTFVLGKRGKREVSQQLCREEKIETYTLANKGGSLAYRVFGTRCAKGLDGMPLQQCNVSFGGLQVAIGSCSEKATKIVLQAMSKCGDQFYKTITFDCSCKCDKYSKY